MVTAAQTASNLGERVGRIGALKRDGQALSTLDCRLSTHLSEARGASDIITVPGDKPLAYEIG